MALQENSGPLLLGEMIEIAADETGAGTKHLFTVVAIVNDEQSPEPKPILAIAEDDEGEAVVLDLHTRQVVENPALIEELLGLYKQDVLTEQQLLAEVETAEN
jgi:hypothetical protein